MNRRAFLFGLCAVPIAAVAVRGESNGERVSHLWNRVVLSINRQNPKLKELEESLHRDRPERAAVQSRKPIYDACIVEAEEQESCLKGMRKAECGQK